MVSESGEVRWAARASGLGDLAFDASRSAAGFGSIIYAGTRRAKRSASFRSLSLPSTPRINMNTQKKPSTVDSLYVVDPSCCLPPSSWADLIQHLQTRRTGSGPRRGRQHPGGWTTRSDEGEADQSRFNFRYALTAGSSTPAKRNRASMGGHPGPASSPAGLSTPNRPRPQQSSTLNSSPGGYA